MTNATIYGSILLMKNKQTFADKLRVLMESRNISIQELSYMVEMPYSTVWKLVRGKSIPHKSTRIAIAVTLKLNQDYFED